MLHPNCSVSPCMIIVVIHFFLSLRKMMNHSYEKGDELLLFINTHAHTQRQTQTQFHVGYPFCKRSTGTVQDGHRSHLQTGTITYFEERLIPNFVCAWIHSLLCNQIIPRNNTLCIFFLFVLVVFFFEFETFSVYDPEDDSTAGEFVFHIITLQLYHPIFQPSARINKKFSE